MPGAGECAAGELGGEVDADEALADALASSEEGEGAGGDPVGPQPPDGAGLIWLASVTIT